ncbi:MAG: hypothetical protein Q7R39_05895 [Dehalococcoidia bacterium]|nr:hypothetical protein [Dehalococcoidia bacterium]
MWSIETLGAPPPLGPPKFGPTPPSQTDLERKERTLSREEQDAAIYRAEKEARKAFQAAQQQREPGQAQEAAAYKAEKEARKAFQAAQQQQEPGQVQEALNKRIQEGLARKAQQESQIQQLQAQSEARARADAEEKARQGATSDQHARGTPNEPRIAAVMQNGGANFDPALQPENVLNTSAAMLNSFSAWSPTKKIVVAGAVLGGLYLVSRMLR